MSAKIQIVYLPTNILPFLSLILMVNRRFTLIERITRLYFSGNLNMMGKVNFCDIGFP